MVLMVVVAWVDGWMASRTDCTLLSQITCIDTDRGPQLVEQRLIPFPESTKWKQIRTNMFQRYRGIMLLIKPKF